MKPIVSIIIPVYNSEEFLEPCIDSLINQSFTNCEFIFVNDGSIDKSSDIIKEYMKKDSRIVLYNQENKGVSEARNLGILKARGKYIGFVDSDDYIEKDMYERLYNIIEDTNCDVVISNFEEELNNHRYVRDYNLKKNEVLNKNYIQDTIVPFFIEKDSLNTVCNKLYKKSIINENNIKFPKGLPLGEDGIFNMLFFSNANSCIYIDYTGYHYREVDGSATRNMEKHDYFQRELDVYNFDLNKLINVNSNVNVKVLKSIKFINNVKSHIYIFFEQNQSKSIFYKYKYIKKILKNNDAIDALDIYLSNVSVEGRYDKWFLYSMKRKSVILLYIACTYSRIRNKR